MRRVLALFVLAIICFGGEVEIKIDDIEFDLRFLTVDGIEYFSTDDLASTRIVDNRIFTAKKRKESLKIFGNLYVFTPYTPFVIIDSDAYSIGVPTYVDENYHQIPLYGFFRAMSLAEGKEIVIEYANKERYVFDGKNTGINVKKTNEPVPPPLPNEHSSAKSQEAVSGGIDSGNSDPVAPPMPGAENSENTQVENMAESTDMNKPSPPPPLPWENHKDQKAEITRESWTIVIDPGHGGKDPGAIGKSGLYEKDVVLDIAKRIKKIAAEEYPELKVKLTREDDTFLPLAKRGEIAREFGGDVFISIHCNASSSSESNGSETFFLSPAKTTDERATELLENKALEYEEDPKYTPSTVAEFILADFAQNEFIRESSRLASKITSKISSSGKLRSRGTSKAAFYVLNDNIMPSVLVEVAFISNADEEKKLQSPDFKDKTARAILGGVEEFIQEFAE